jgi:hypothetical protein
MRARPPPVMLTNTTSVTDLELPLAERLRTEAFARETVRQDRDERGNRRALQLPADSCTSASR